MIIIIMHMFICSYVHMVICEYANSIIDTQSLIHNHIAF